MIQLAAVHPAADPYAALAWRAESLGLAATRAGRGMDGEDRRAELGQFLTPAPLAAFLASMIGLPGLAGRPVRLLDAGAGVGTLAAAATAALLDRPAAGRPSAVRVTAWELDARLEVPLRRTLADCERACAAAGVGFAADVRAGPGGGDFVLGASGLLAAEGQAGGLFPAGGESVAEGGAAGGAGRFDLAVLNPPYRKLRGGGPERGALSAAGVETSNLYAAFLWLAARLLAPGGELVAITPRSYFNGGYFRPLRRYLAAACDFRRVHVYDARDAAFAGDGVLQENAVVRLVKRPAPSGGIGDGCGKGRPPVLVTASHGPDDGDLSERLVPWDEVVRPGDPQAVIAVVADESEARLSAAMRRLPATLGDLGVSASTGRVVEFRARGRLSAAARPGDAPLLYPRHLDGAGGVRWPLTGGRGAGKPGAIAVDGPGDGALLPPGWYVLVKRFSAKEERRRLVAATLDPARLPADAPGVAVDNKLNVLHQRGGPLDGATAKGLALFLNSTAADAHFRLSSGHTQVNAGDLRRLPLPDAAALARLAEHVNGRMPAQAEIDRLVAAEAFNDMAKTTTDDSPDAGPVDPAAAKRKVQEAKDVLQALKVPKAQRNERSALTLLGLLDLTPEKPWAGAGGPPRGVTGLMGWMADHYGKRYAPNTRETVRRYTLHQLVEMGLVLLNADEPARPVNSPNNAYRMEPSALEAVRAFGTVGWEEAASKYLAASAGRNRLRAKARNIDRIPVTLPDGRTLALTGGGQNVVVKEIVERFAPRFVPGGHVAYVGDAGEKHLLYDAGYLGKLGVEIDPHGKMPDVVLHHRDRDWLVLVEAVTSHGPVSPLRHAQLAGLFAGSTAGLVYVTAFLDRAAMREHLAEIAWETEVWVADAPDHLIHFNGERFLGPHEAHGATPDAESGGGERQQ